jgi:cell division inhibitor SepF
MVIIRARAFSESQQIADHLRSRDTVVIKPKTSNSEQAKRIVDFVSGTIYAIWR